MLASLLALAATPWVSIAPASLPASAEAHAALQDTAPKKTLSADEVAARLKGVEAKVSQAELLLSELGKAEQAQAAAREAGLLLKPLLNDKALEPLTKGLTLRILAITGDPARGSEDGENGGLGSADVPLGARAAGRSGSNADIDGQVEVAIHTGNVAFLHQLGARSVPGLVAFLDSREDEYCADISKDPLTILLTVAPRQADAFVMRRMQEGSLSVLFKLRFARAVESAFPFGFAASWKSATPGAGDSTLPNLLSLCDQMVTDAEYREPITFALYGVASHGIFLPGMRAAIRDELASPAGLSENVSRWISNNSAESIRDLLLENFLPPDARTRNLVHRALLKMPSNAGIYGAVLAGEVVERLNGLNWLVERRVLDLPGTPGAQGERTQYWLPPLGDGAAAYVDALLRDPNPEVRRNVTKDLYLLGRDDEELVIPALPEYEVETTTIGASSLDLPLATETLMALVADEDVLVRVGLADCAGLLPWEQQQPVLAALAVDPDSNVRLSARIGLSNLAWYQHPEDCTKILRSSFAMESDPRILGGLLPRYSNKFNLASRSPEGLEALLNWAVDTQDKALLENALAQTGQPREMLKTVSPETWARALIAFADSYADHPNFSPGTSLQFSLRTLPTDRQGPAANAILDVLTQTPAPSLFAQVFALHAIPGSGDDRIPKAIATFLSTPEGVTLADMQRMDGSKIGQSMIKRFPAAVRAQAGEALLKVPGAAQDTIDRAFHQMGQMLPITPEIAAAVVADPAHLEGSGALAGRVASWMANHSDAVDGPWLSALVDHPNCGEEALKAIGHLRDPDMLPVIAKVIVGPAGHPHYSAATDALKGFLSDESAKLLLIAARKTPSEDQRTWCLAQVEKVAALQDAEERWASRGIKRATREATVGKLMALIGSQDKAVRIEAVRGLATWEAVEAMPELIGLLAAPDADVAQAAREALDRLNGR